MPDPQDMLLVRASDQFIAALSWSGYTLAAASPSGAQLVASGAGPRELTLLLPPQSVGEAKYAQGAADLAALRGARFSAPSRLVFRIADANAVDLTVAALLQALSERGELRVEGDAPTTVELPWHLPLTPRSNPGGAPRLSTAYAPALSGAGVAGLSVLHLSAADGGILRLQPQRPNLDDAALDVAPLSAAEREMIFDAASADPATWAEADRLELSALGGWLDAHLDTAGFSFTQRTAMGRDSSAHISVRGVLYPTGHRAVYLESADRTVAPPQAPHAVAGLQRTQKLVIVEPTRTLADAPLDVQRQFPFDALTLVATAFPGLQPAAFQGVPRPVLPDDDLRDELQASLAEQDAIREACGDAFREAPHSVAAYTQLLISQELPLGLDWQEARLKAHINPDLMQQRRDKAIVSLRNAQLALTRALNADPQDPDQIAGLDANIDALNTELNGELSSAAIARARAELPMWQAKQAQLEQDIAQEYATQDTLDEFIITNLPQSARFQEVQQSIATCNARIAEIQAATGTIPPSFFLPAAADGKPFQFTMRCRGTLGDVMLSMPLVFLRDEVLPAGDHLNELSFTRDPAVLKAVQECWKNATAVAATARAVVADGGAVRRDVRAAGAAGVAVALVNGLVNGLPGDLAASLAGAVSLPGVAVDLVRDLAQPGRPGDIHEVHTLALLGLPTNGRFWPQVRAVEVELPALRSLLPEVSPRQFLKYSAAYASTAAIPEMPLRFIEQLGVDFSKVADRSGGLVSPSFVADGIAREFGVAAASAVPRALTDAVVDLPDFDPRSAFKDATLLGLPLSSLMALAAGDQPSPPGIVQLFEKGTPLGVEMTWTLALAPFGPFRPLTSATRLEVVVRRTLTDMQTTCTVDGFQFVLPSGGSDGARLLTLEFGALKYTLKTGSPPKLEIPSFKVSFGGALKLLKEMEEALQSFLDVGGPRIDARPDGISATYALDIPRLPTAGVFVIEGLGVTTSVDVPFNAQPVTFSLSFASRDKPFHVTVLAFGGGGYIEVTLGPDGLRRLEAAIEFGAAIAVDFFIARGEVHAFGGIRFIENEGSIDIDAYLDIGGSIEVLGLVSVSIALLILLHYESAGNRLVGRARVVIEIDLTLYSKSVTIDSGEWVLAGSAQPEHGREALAGPADTALLQQRWSDYLNAFATT